MCGIAGIAKKDGSRPDEGALFRMSEAIKHRGPDGDALWAEQGIGLAHRRLAIIDLNETAAQPMQDSGGNYHIVFNGEIYNYRELREELEKHGAVFKTQSDTEVILEAYRAWDVGCLIRLKGMFAFALWDHCRGRLFIARDKIGKKPLYYSFTDSGDLIFASEIKAFAQVIKLKPSLTDLRLFIGLQYVPSPRTGFEGVQQVLPGCYGIWDGNCLEMSRYHEWDSPKTTDIKRSWIDLPDREIDDLIRTTLDQAVAVRQLASDVSVGAFLSGGIDSAAIVALASKHVTRPVQTFTMGFPQLHRDERREARAISEKFSTDHQEFEAKPEDLQSLVNDLTLHYDAPYADSSALPLWLLAKATADEIKVVLTGDGGDELFGGYRRYAVYDRAYQISRIPFAPLLAAGTSKLIAQMAHDPRFNRLSDVLETLRHEPRQAYGEMFCGAYFSTSWLKMFCQPEFLAETQKQDAVCYIAEIMRERKGLRTAMFFDLISYLPDDLNVKMDRATMRFGLEARSPFLDESMVSLALRLPLKQKVCHGKTKVALRRALAKILPADILERPKRGFQVPLAEWFRGPLGDFIHDKCLDPNSSLSSIFKPEAIKHLIEDNKKGNDHGNRLWMLLSLATWLERYPL
ncbi:MAG: asparagine synthase (glutamine-hydrolyzing) [Patescibacteria group bacterium]